MRAHISPPPRWGRILGHGWASRGGAGRGQAVLGTLTARLESVWDVAADSGTPSTALAAARGAGSASLLNLAVGERARLGPAGTRRPLRPHVPLRYPSVRPAAVKTRRTA